MRKAILRKHDFRDDAERSGAAAFALDMMRRRPIDTLAGLVATAGVAMILINALLLQEGRHPAPLFHDAGTHASARPVAAPAPVAPQRSDLVAQIQDGLVARGYFDGPVDGLFGGKTAAAILTFEQAARLPATGEPSERVLAALLVAPAVKDASRPPFAPAAKAPAPVVTGSISAPKLMAVQRVLGKLGYGPVAVDGKMGAGTRAALIAFEHDRKLPQTGEPGAQVLKELQAVSGATLE